MSSVSQSASSNSDYEPESSEPDVDTELYNVKNNSLMATRYHDLHDSMHYLGIPSNFLFILSLLGKRLSFSGKHLEKRDVVSLILRKVKGNLPFKTLGHQFGISESYAAKLFNQHIKCLSSSLKQLIRWLPPQTVFENLPVAFWSRFRETYVIIDTFEIQIEKPSNAFDQSETYSEYKKCNTLKYLIGASPDGTIMYVSQGFLGRFSDLQITLKSNFFDGLPRNVHVMADRGFKGLDTLLQDKGMKLVRPPSVASGEVLPRSMAIFGKKVASLRIHIERCIGRLRLFLLLDPHSTIAHRLQNSCDDAVIIACGLINCSSPLIKI
ncbi:uncharacterized protein LOC124172258 isoform X1 [Ischnura elegans]|uniref:uncharacterized protein LOC124172258 isoform X1 n=1 Tax=Ischnura elegans TaxID=197161 RepID=UPI001ED8A4FF|nr:uncharacterized protein LOC124172258 isoform X1 [Ischnura elegans]XP_046407636.1 uncharacterized protein LOC124172258 isoform X1 [Ischnura elegans]